jgi:hypothetical protein
MADLGGATAGPLLARGLATMRNLIALAAPSVVCTLLPVLAAGCAVTPAETSETTESALIIPLVPNPDVVVQLRKFGNCLPQADADGIAADLQARFRAQVSENAIARARCVLSPGASNIPATTIGVWSTGSFASGSLLDTTLDAFDVLTDAHSGGINLGTFVSRRFMKGRLAAAAKSTEKFTVKSTDVLLNASSKTVQTVISGEGSGFIGIDATIRLTETLVPLTAQQTPYLACKDAPAAFDTTTVRTFESLIPDGILEDSAPETGVLTGLVDGGFYSSRALIAPLNPATPTLLSAMHITYDPEDVRVNTSGLLEGLVVVSDPFLENRQPCAKIDPPAVISGLYSVDTFDTRGAPNGFQWSGQGVIPLTPAAPTTRITLLNGIGGVLSVSLKDGDNVPLQAERFVSTIRP